VKLIGANFLDPQPIRRTAKETAELGYRTPAPAQAGSFNAGRHHRGFAGDFPRNPHPLPMPPAIDPASGDRTMMIDKFQP
jgi:hypothetical protein